MTQTDNAIDWRTIIRRIKTGKCTPLIGNLVSNEYIFGQDEDVGQAWAEMIGYPLADKSNLTRVAQFKSVISQDTLSAKEEYLEFLKQRLLEIARDRLPDDQNAFLATLEDELFDLSFSEVAERLGYPRYEDEQQNPLRILAELPIPIYLTTSPYPFMEAALKAAGKQFKSEICYWRDDLNDIPSIFNQDPDFRPAEDMPLVYHLHGLDAYPASLVLTEDDYLDFLVKVSQDIEVIPNRIAQALTDSSLLLLGYKLQSWDFRVIFRGLIKAKRASRRLLSLSIQLTPTEDESVTDLPEARHYLEQYFDEANFDIYWGHVQGFTQELWHQWENQP